MTAFSEAASLGSSRLRQAVEDQRGALTPAEARTAEFLIHHEAALAFETGASVARKAAARRGPVPHQPAPHQRGSGPQAVILAFLAVVTCAQIGQERFLPRGQAFARHIVEHGTPPRLPFVQRHLRRRLVIGDAHRVGLVDVHVGDERALPERRRAEVRRDRD